VAEMLVLATKRDSWVAAGAAQALIAGAARGADGGPKDAVRPSRVGRGGVVIAVDLAKPCRTERR
jgi:hypothetical protein